MSENKFGDKLQELDLSHEEIDRLTKCMKDEKFRDLLREYAEEIADPENRRKYEEEIAQLERERGMNVKFINPTPGHVLKTSINGNQKCFINICINDNLGQPKSKPSVQGTTKGMQWSIPHSVSQAREDVDKAGTKCIVYDVVFHPDTYYLLKKNARFKKMIHDTALDAVERQFDVKLDKINVKTPKMTFKGLPMSSVIRTPNPNGPVNDESTSLEDDNPKLRPPPPPPPPAGAKTVNGMSTESKPSQQENWKEQVSKTNEVKKEKNVENGRDRDCVEPNYTITHRGHFDIQDYRVAPGNVQSTVPKELVINIDLPLLSAANSVNLEIFAKQLLLESEHPAKYKLDLKLPYRVAEKKGFAKFDKSRHRLIVTLEVLPLPPQPLHSSYPPPLVAEVEKHDEESNKCPDKEIEDVNSEHSDTSSTSASATSKTASSAIREFNEATEVTTEATIANIGSNQSKDKKKGDRVSTSAKRHTFVEKGRRHYQEGSNWNDDGDDVTVERSGDKRSMPLTKNSAFLIDMVMKYEGLVRRCPQYSFHQDEDYVSFIIEVPRIFEESLWYAVYGDMLQFCCLSECVDDDMVNSVFQLWIEFEKGFSIDPQRSRVDVSGSNAVFCLRKTKSNLIWEQTKAGFDKDNLDVRRFATARNVSEFYTLVFKHAEGVTASPLACCRVAEKERDLVILEFEQAKDKEDITKTSTDDKEKSAAAESNKDEASNTEASGDSKSRNPSKSVSFNEEGEKTSLQDEDESMRDSDDDERPDVPPTPPQGLVTITGSDDSKEVISNHVSKSAVQLASDSLIYELDDDI